MDTTELIDRLELQGRALAASADRTDLAAPVPTCPGWSVRDLLGHVGMIHRWAATHVREGRRAFAGNAGAPSFPAPQDGVVAWLREGHEELVAALRAAPDDLDAMTFLAHAGPARHFWARRQAHETAVHHADAAAVLGEVPELDLEFALDGIGELLEGFYGRRGGRLRADPAITLRVAPSDAAASWRIDIGAEGRVVTPDGPGPADCTLRGPSAALYLDLWNRPPATPVSVEGDARAVALWRELARVRWG